MELLDEILNRMNIEKAIRKVQQNKGAPGMDKMQVWELNKYFSEHLDEIRQQIYTKKYKPQPVRRVYIPKPNGKQRPLGIPTVVDRVIQQAIAQVFSGLFDTSFSNFSFGFRPNRDCHMAVNQALNYLKEGYEWIVDFDIEKFFDTVNHDKLISILREKVKDDITLHLIREYLKAGVMEDGLVSPTEGGVPQGGPLSPVLSNIYLDKLDKELENRGLRFVRYADDFDIFVRSQMAADRVMESVSTWIEKKLFLKVSATKTKVVRPMNGSFLGFTFWKDTSGWKPRPLDDRKPRLISKVREILVRQRANATPLSVIFTKLNQVLRGWINYFGIVNMKGFMESFGQWLRHKVRVFIVKQWKKPRTICRNLIRINALMGYSFSLEEIYIAANTRLGLYKSCSMRTISGILSPQVLSIPNKTESRPGLVDPLCYYLCRHSSIIM